MDEIDRRLFFRVIKDIAEHGWSKSKASDTEKYWTIGQIMRNLPEFWVISLFNAAREGIEASSEMIKFLDKEENAYKEKLANEWIFGRRSRELSRQGTLNDRLKLVKKKGKGAGKDHRYAQCGKTLKTPLINQN